MKLPININDLLTARTVEWERLEFKAGWNPKAVLHTMCAFANDFHNLGGGYIIIGVAEGKGRPVLPPIGLPVSQIDAVQKEIVELGYRMVPYYHPIIAPYEIEGKHILVLWAAGGQTRPYKAPVSLKKGEHEFAYYIRKGSVTGRARHTTEESAPGLEVKSGVESGVESEMAILILNDLRENELGKKDMAKRLGKPKPTRYLNDLVRKMAANGLIEFTIPDKPTSRLQRYRLTNKGRTWLDAIHERVT